ncbi:PAC2 family protein [Candidatus Bathyarchaeota archaeon]|nr:PAC2 family protein [Candidatus Bathyarchaeota archaeon]
MKISSNTQIIEIIRPNLEDPILIQGLPGLGFVGKIVVDFLIDQLKPTKFAELYSPNIALPDGDVGVTVELDSTFTLPKYEFYAYTNNKPHVILLTGDTQPNPWGQYNIAKSVLDFVEGFKCRTVVAVGGYALQRREMEIVYAVGSEPSIVSDLKEKFNVQPAQSGMIKGAFGVTLGLGKGRNLKCLGLLGATVGTYPDLRASRNVIRMVASMFDLPVVLSDIDKKIEDMDSRVKRFKDINRTIPTGEGQEAGEPPRGYIT